MEDNGTSVVDVTNPRQPKYVAHIPGGGEAQGPGQAQMARVCTGADLPKADKSKVYLLRALGSTGHEIWDVTTPEKPSRLTVVVNNMKETHKSFWECDTGIGYLVGGDPAWRTPRMIKIYDLSDPAKPVFIRDFGLNGQQPGSTMNPVPTEMHGPISLGAKANRIYIGYGTGRNGIVQIIDRKKLLEGPKEPTEANLLYPQIGPIDLPIDAGAHTAFPLLRSCCRNSASRIFRRSSPMPRRPPMTSAAKASRRQRRRACATSSSLLARPTGTNVMRPGSSCESSTRPSNRRCMAYRHGTCRNRAETSARAGAGSARIRATRT